MLLVHCGAGQGTQALQSPSQAHQGQSQDWGVGSPVDGHMPGACLEGEVALAGGLQTSAVGCPVECVASATQALEAARGVDADVVTGPLEGTLINICGHRERGWGVSLRRLGRPVAHGTSCLAGPWVLRLSTASTVY